MMSRHSRAWMCCNEDERSTLSKILGLISTFEHQQGRPMLSAVVVHAEYGIPGAGFFQLARELDVLKSKSRIQDPLFWHQELKSVHATWSQ